MLSIVRVIKNFGIYFIGSALLKSTSFILAPLTIYFLKPEEVGLLSLLNSFIAITSVIITFGLRQVLYIEFFHKNNHERIAMINDLIGIYCALALPIILLLYTQLTFLNTHIFAEIATPLLLIIVLVQCFLSFFSELFYQVLIYRGQAFKLIQVQIFGAAITLVLTLAALYLWHASLVGILLANTTGIIAVCCCGLYEYIKKSLHKAHDVMRIKKNMCMYLVAGLPFIPSLLSAWIIASSNRWILASYCSLTEVGLYSLLEMLGSLFQMFILYPLGAAYVPYVFEQFAQNKNSIQELDTNNKKIMLLAMACLFLLACAGFFMFKSLAYTILPVFYHTVVPYSLLLITGYILLMGTYFASCYIQFCKKTIFLSGSLVISAVVNMCLSFILIPRYAIFGGLIALVVAYAVYFLITLAYNQWLHKTACLKQSILLEI